MLVVGDREAEEGTVAVRRHGEGDEGTVGARRVRRRGSAGEAAARRLSRAYGPNSPPHAPPPPDEPPEGAW